MKQKVLPALEGGGRYPVSESLIIDALAGKTIMEGNFEKEETHLKNRFPLINRNYFKLTQMMQFKSDAILMMVFAW